MKEWEEPREREREKGREGERRREQERKREKKREWVTSHYTHCKRIVKESKALKGL